ncbi:tigger transposable element-derived protein 4-like [Hetaerina americana]|uniref:tigger transposable element-derived protein 4-like n=1 Tax=Hetaerina americana TaxID=62018 RepID=UPI003A7F3E72
MHNNDIFFFIQTIISAQKRKRTDFPLKEKKDIIDAAKEEPNQSKLARQIRNKWSVEVRRTTVKGILSKKGAIEAAIKAGDPSKSMKLTQAHDPKLDEGVLTWLKQGRGQNLPVSGDLINEKVMKLAELMHIPDLMASDGWLGNFKKRHGITFKTVQGEAGAVDSQSLIEWQQQVLRPLLRQVSADNVFNLDKANSKTRMTAELFEEILCDWDGRIGQQGRRVVVCLDNFTGHPPELHLDNIQLVLFPPNTTANSQSMDQGIIKNLNCHYEKLLLCRRLVVMDKGKELKFTLLDALHVARRAWEHVGKSTIGNCFTKAKFIEEEIQTEAQNAELIEIWEPLPT